jgi:hypothetical protein
VQLRNLEPRRRFFRSIHTASVRLHGCFFGAGARSYSLSGFAGRTQKSPASSGMGVRETGEGSRTSHSLKEKGLGSSVHPRTRFPSNIHTNLFLLTSHPTQTQSPTHMCSSLSGLLYAAFFCTARNLAHLAFCAAAIFLRVAGEMARFGFTVSGVFATSVGFDPPRTFAHLAFCAMLILRRAEGDKVCFGFVALPDIAAPAPFSDSIPEIIWSNFSISSCAWLRFSRSSRSALSKLDIVAPSGILFRTNCNLTGVTTGRHHLRSQLEHDAPASRAAKVGRAAKATASVTKQIAIRRVSVLAIEIQKDFLFINATADRGH